MEDMANKIRINLRLVAVYLFSNKFFSKFFPFFFKIPFSLFFLFQIQDFIT